MKVFLAIAAAIILIGVYFWVARSRQGDDKFVTLKAGPGNAVVQMFDRIGDQADTIKQLPDGATCTKVSGPIATDVSGIGMSFYLITCDGVTGYVNAKWVH